MGTNSDQDSTQNKRSFWSRLPFGRHDSSPVKEESEHMSFDSEPSGAHSSPRATYSTNLIFCLFGSVFIIILSFHISSNLYTNLKEFIFFLLQMPWYRVEPQRPSVLRWPHAPLRSRDLVNGNCKLKSEPTKSYFFSTSSFLYVMYSFNRDLYFSKVVLLFLDKTSIS